MNYKQNLHTHSTFCDGADIAEEMIVEAIKKGFDSIGFSGHSYMHYSPEHSMSLEGIDAYKSEIARLKEKYKDSIKVFCGLEFDMYSQIDLLGYDYLIGAVHYLLCGNEFVGFDRSQYVVADIINRYFDGDGMKYAKAYYHALSDLPQYGKFDIVAHFDLITKHRDNVMFFNEDSKEYKSAAIEAAEALSGKIPFFEVNTGAIARGYRNSPYPSLFLLRELKRLGFGAIISSDCHDKKMLDCAFDDATELLKSAGFKERYILTEKGFEEVALL